MDNVEYKGMRVVLTEHDSATMEYLQAAARGSLIMRTCTSCDLMHYPPATACPWCGEPGLGWREVSGRGEIYSYEVVTQAIQPAFRDWVPYPVVIVELDEQKGKPTEDNGLRLLTNLLTPEGRPESEEMFRIGDRVCVCFTQLSDELALPQFQLDR